MNSQACLTAHSGEVDIKTKLVEESRLQSEEATMYAECGRAGDDWHHI